MSREAVLQVIRDLVNIETTQELHTIYEAMKAKSSDLRQHELTDKVLSGTLMIGAKVKFLNSRHGTTVHGIVEKINRKNVKIKEMRPNPYNPAIMQTVNWTVSPNLLQPDNDGE